MCHRGTGQHHMRKGKAGSKFGCGPFRPSSLEFGSSGLSFSKVQPRALDLRGPCNPGHSVRRKHGSGLEGLAAAAGRSSKHSLSFAKQPRRTNMTK